MGPTLTPQATDPLPGLVGFTVVLRNAGLAITTDRVAAFLSALDALDVTDRAQTYWAGELTPAEREHLRRLMALLRPEMPQRVSRRLRPSAHGGTDPGRTLRAALRNHGELRELRRRDRSRRSRRVVLLLDVSGSMEPYADSLLRFAHVVVRRAPGAVEVFTLGTRLTRVTRELQMRDAERALAATGKAIPDWSGGTRLGDVLRAFV